MRGFQGSSSGSNVVTLVNRSDVLNRSRVTFNDVIIVATAGLTAVSVKDTCAFRTKCGFQVNVMHYEAWWQRHVGLS